MRPSVVIDLPFPNRLVHHPGTQMASTTDRLARARAARQAKMGALAPSEGSERLSAAQRLSEAHRLSEARRLSACGAAWRHKLRAGTGRNAVTRPIAQNVQSSSAMRCAIVKDFPREVLDAARRDADMTPRCEDP